MPVQGILIGRDAVAYYAKQTDTPWPVDPDDAAVQTWLDLATTAEAQNIMDLTDDISSEMTDATTRAEARKGWTSEIAVLRTGQVQFDFRWEPDDAFIGELIARWEDGSGLSMCFLDQPGKAGSAFTASGAQGLGAYWSVSLTKQEALRDVQKASCTLTVAKHPLWTKGRGL